MTDLLAGAAMLGLAVMRVGCLFNGCCHGSPTDSAFSVVLADPRCAADPACLGVPLHPCQVYESAGCLLIFLVVYGPLFRRVRDGSLPAGASFVGAYAAYALLRSLTDPLRADAVLCPGLQGLSAAQALSMSSFAAFWLLWERAQSGVLSWRRIGETAVRAEDICLPPLLLSASCVGLSLALTRGPSPAAASAVLGLIEAWALLTRGRALEGPLRPAEVLLPLAAAGLFAAFNLLPLVPEGWDASLAAGPLLPALTAAGAAVFLLGVVLAAASIAHLGSSFGLVVQVRGIVKTGPYRFTRHPIYLGYCLIAAGSCLLRPMLSTVLLSAAACAALAARARLEEARLAASCAEYREYLAVPTRGLLRKT
jgi:protein-S-isoprenylcysteine O-methyltransferase Ste14